VWPLHVYKHGPAEFWLEIQLISSSFLTVLSPFENLVAPNATLLNLCVNVANFLSFQPFYVVISLHDENTQ